MIFKDRKGISVVLIVVLVLFIAVVTGIALYNWFLSFSEDWELKSQAEARANIEILGIKANSYGEGMIGVRNKGRFYLVVNGVKVDGSNCMLLSTNIIEGVETIYVNCSVASDNNYEVDIFTNRGTFSKTLTAE